MNGASYVASTVQMPCSTAAPALRIEPLDFAPGIMITWPITCNQYILETATTLNAPPSAWEQVWETVTPVGGTYVVVLLQSQYDGGYFRLRRL
jgi:hypothetical protein